MKTTQDKQHTSMKIVSAILCIGIIVSVIVNIYQFNSNGTLKNDVATLQSNIQALETESDTLNKEIESKQTTVSDLSLQIEDLNSVIEQLEADNQSLSDSLQALDDGINSTHTDVELTDDEYQGDEATDGANITLNEEEQAAVNRIEENLRKKHPEWFTDTPSQDSGYVSVDAPVDNGEPVPEFDMSGDSGVAPGTVY